MGQFATDDAAMLAGTAAGDDFDAPKLLGISGVQKTFERVKSGLRGAAVQVERAGGGELAGAEAVPTGFVESGRVFAGDQRARAFGGFGGGGRREGGVWGGRRRDGDGRCERHVAARKRRDVAYVVGPFGTIVVGEGARTPGHGFDLARHAGLCMLARAWRSRRH